jgi:nicotinate-nucleotide adenylyltransferase
VRIAIFGGSFDPIHVAHVAIVESALDKLDIDKLIIVPTYLNPFKNSFNLNPETRFELLKKVFHKFKNVEISDYEINQQKTSYSFNTVNYLKNLYKPSKIYLIIGEDNINDLDKWYKYDELKKLVEFVVASRTGFETKKANEFKSLDININISSTELRDKINLNYIPIEIKDDILNLKKKGKSF